MTGEKNPNPGQEQPVEQQPAQHSGLKRILAIGGLVAVGALGATGLEAITSFGDSTHNNSPGKSAQPANNTVTGENGVTLTNSVEGLVQGKFLPKTTTGKIESKPEAESYLKSLFNSNGPLAGETNRCSLSAMDAAAVALGTSPHTDNAYSYTEQFTSDLNSLNGDNGVDAGTFGSNLSDKENVFLGDNAHFDPHALGNGDGHVIELLPVMENGVCTGMKLHPVTINADTPALVFSLQGNKTLELNGVEVNLKAYSRVILPGDGSILIPGVFPQPQPTKGGDKNDHKHPGKAGSKVSKETAPVGSHLGGSTHQGPSPEQNQGPNKGPSKGPASGPNHGAKPGPEQTPSGGGGSGGGNGPAPSPGNGPGNNGPGTGPGPGPGTSPGCAPNCPPPAGGKGTDPGLHDQ